MKRILLFVFLAIICIIAKANKSYTMTITDPNTPGSVVKYEIVEPIYKDPEQHFVHIFQKYLRNKSKWPQYVKVKVSFILDKDGFVRDPQILDKENFTDSSQLIEIFKMAEPINPGLINGERSAFLGIFEENVGNLKIYWTPLITDNN